METVDLSKLSTEELETVLNQRKAAETAEREQKRKEYEQERDDTVIEFVERAVDLGKQLMGFKEECHVVMDLHQEKLSEYGGISKTSKGGFSLMHSEAELKMTRRRATEPFWDERSDKGSALVAEFLSDKLKKIDENMYEMLMSYIARNEKGELDYSRVMILLQHEGKYDDPRWVEGLRLIRESYSIHLRGYSYEFHVKNDQGKWMKIELNFSAI